MTWIRAAMSLFAVLAALAAPGTALAAVEVSYSRTGGLVVNATTRANLELSDHEVDGVQGFDVRQIIGGVLTADTIDGGDGCDETSLARVFCPVTNSRAVRVTLSDEELVFDSGLAIGDGLTVFEVQVGDPAFIEGITVDGRGDNDGIQGSKGRDTLLGSDGGDQLTPDKGNDIVDGGPGDDQLVASNFPRAEPGTLLGPNGADVYKGGLGSDEVGYYGLRVPIVVTLDGQANDGVAGENDNVGPDNDVETVRGGERDDRLVGNDGANELDGKSGDDTITGGAGNDKLVDFLGDDTINGGPGADILRDTGGGGPDGTRSADTLDARDGTRDLVIDCGGGLGDTAIIDLFDTPKIVKNCELVTSFAIDDGPPATPRGGRLRIPADGVARVAIACPRRAKVRCHGRVSIRDPKRRRHALASASYAAGLGRTARVGLALKPSERALLRRRGRALLTTQERGISRRGPRGAERLVPLAGQRR